ncbi:hypothetical protein NDU88_009873 [Pleurodeles waltl]|uniref:Uncharacterized protein n=1 Tax=Pleurodeles waltl TaxID=8319 RepID=A0AAV7S296_PLEWA|nr:hypothetical protein NDU88_009873 [Pleurodeles waltl]
MPLPEIYKVYFPIVDGIVDSAVDGVVADVDVAAVFVAGASAGAAIVMVFFAIGDSLIDDAVVIVFVNDAEEVVVVVTVAIDTIVAEDIFRDKTTIDGTILFDESISGHIFFLEGSLNGVSGTDNAVLVSLLRNLDLFDSLSEAEKPPAFLTLRRN